MKKTYSELIKFCTFKERLEYLSMNGTVCDRTFGGHRYLNQRLYESGEWNRIRRMVILRDNGCDLALSDYPIGGSIYIHHLDPITIDDILRKSKKVFDMENLVCVSFRTHNSIHYGSQAVFEPAVRMLNDTCLWK